MSKEETRPPGRRAKLVDGLRFPYTFVVKGRYWRFRRGDLKAALPGQPGEPAFLTRYAELVAQSEQAPADRDEASMAWLIRQYRASAEYGALRPLTQHDYGKTLDLLTDEMGEEPFALITAGMVKDLRDDHAATPRKAHKIKQTLSLLYTWAAENGHVPLGFNPAAPIRRLKTRPKPITPWSEEEIALFMGACPSWLQTAVLLALYTGQRREDVVAMEWDCFQGAFIRVKQSKTGEPLDIACHRDLRKHLAAIKTRFGGPIARTAAGRPFTPNSLSQAIRRIVDGLEGMPKDRSIHGLRYAAAARLDEAGVGPVDAAAVLGHRTYAMAMKYLSQRKRSAAAIAKQEANE